MDLILAFHKSWVNKYKKTVCYFMKFCIEMKTNQNQTNKNKTKKRGEGKGLGPCVVAYFITYIRDGNDLLQ